MAGGGDNGCADTDTLISPPPEKRQKIDESPPTDATLDENNEPKESDMYDSDSSLDSGSMTREEYEPYNKMVDETDGYYVPELASDRALWAGYIRQEGISDEFVPLVQHAIEFNKTNQTETEKKNLKFLKVTNCTSQITGYITFYITFEAEDEDTGELATFQTRISKPCGRGAYEVEQFRLKPLVPN